MLLGDFLEAQAEKDICGRKIAPMKSHIHVKEGYAVTTAEDMVVALNSFGDVRDCYAAVLTMQSARPYSKWAGLTTYMNFTYELEAVCVWKGTTSARETCTGIPRY